MRHNQIKIGKKVWTVVKEAIPMLTIYKHNKRKPVGSKIECPVCLNNFIKVRESYAFCGIVCKDDFWNKIDPRKRNNNGKNRHRYTHVEPHWCDSDWEDCDYHNKE